MARTTDMSSKPRSLSQLNRILQRDIDPSIVLVRGSGYFYGTFGKYGMLPSIPVCYLGDQSIHDWVMDVKSSLSITLLGLDCATISEFDARVSPQV